MHQEIEKKIFVSEMIASELVVKLSLVRTGFFSSAANVLASSLRIWHVKSRDFIQLS